MCPPPVRIRDILSLYWADLWSSPEAERLGPCVRCGYCERVYLGDAWRKLDLVNATRWPGIGATIEVRHCPCGSSLTLERKDE